MREFRAELFGDVTHELSEGPVWDDATETVTWVDIVRGRVYQGHLGDSAVVVDRVQDFGLTVGAAVPAADGGLLVAVRDGLVAVSTQGRRSAVLPLLDPGDANRLNDGACDPAGRFLVGTLATDARLGSAALLRLEADGSTTVLRQGLNLANGIDWSPAGDVIYLADSRPGVVWRATYDPSDGAVGAWTPLLERLDGLPDGLCVDSEGCLWVAQWGAAQVRRYSPTGEPLAVVRLPAPHVTSVAFVGPARDRLLLTTARDELEDADRDRFPLSGRLFIADVGASGLPTRRWAGSTSAPPWEPGGPR